MEITADTIIAYLEKAVASKEPMAPDRWLEACQRLLVLSGDISDKLFELQHKIALFKGECIASGDTAAKAKIKAETLDEFVEAQKLKAKLERIYEMVKVSKLQARMRNDEKSNY